MSPAAERTWATKLLILVLGAWFAASVFMSVVAGGNFRILDPERLRNAAVVYESLDGPGERKMALRYAAGELNRAYFLGFNVVQLGLATASLVLLGISRAGRKIDAAILIVCLVLCMAFVFWFTPIMINRGRAIDFIPRDPEPPPEVLEFYRFHTKHVVLESVKTVLTLGLAIMLVVRRRRPAL